MLRGSPKKNLRSDLLNKLGIKASTLSNRLRPLKERHALSPDQALWVYAASSGMQLRAYLSEKKLIEAQNAIRHVNSSAPIRPTAAPPRPKSKSGHKASANEVRFKLPTGKIYTDPELSKKIGNQAKEMSQHYSVLYLLENSIRTLFREILLDEYGKDWWEKNFKKGSASGAKQEIERRMTSQKERRRWHQKASNCPLDFASLEQLKVLMMSKNALLFPEKLGIKKENFSVWIGDLISIRNVLCHMNPLDATSIKDLSVKYDQWIKLCKAYKESKASHPHFLSR